MTTSKTQSEIWSALAAEAQAGDKRAYAQLLREILPFIKSTILVSLANPDWADDIAQEVLLSIHKSLHTYSPDRPFIPWLKAIINFRRTDYLRQYYKTNKQKHLFSEMLEFQGNSVTNPHTAGEYKDIQKALSQLPQKQRKIIELLKIQGHSVKEVANELNMSESAVKVSSHRALKKLQGQIGMK